MNSSLSMVLGLGFAYLFGALPLGYWWSRWATGVDIRRTGSGNIGASNALRAFGALYFLGVLLFDVTKTITGLWLALWCVGAVAPDWYPFVAATAVVVGSVCSICLSGCGGRGVATLLGVLVGVYAWQVYVPFMLCWALLLALTCRPFIASLVATATACGAQWWFAGTGLPLWWLFGALCLVVYTHRGHIIDSLAGLVRPCLWQRWFGK